ncbi:MAG: nucleotidyltransferase family protein [Solirubrobacteraceae bacterium]
MAAAHDARAVRIFGSIARGDAGPGSDLDLLVDMGDGPSLVEQAGLQGDLDDLLGCPVDVVTTGGLSYAREHTRDRIEHEAVSI